MAYEYVPKVHIEILTVGGSDTKVALSNYSLEIVAVLEKYRNGMTDTSRTGKLYKDFLNKRKDTDNMWDRFSMWNELEKNGAVNVRIDYRGSGLGSNSCGPELLEKYRVQEKEFRFGFAVK